MAPELITAIGGAIAAAATAFFGGKNSLNGFKVEVRESFKHLKDRGERIENKVDALTLSDAVQNERLRVEDERISKLENEARKPVLVPDEEPR